MPAPVATSVTDLSYDEFYCREFINVAREAFYVLGDKESAVEVAQEAFIRLYQRWGKISRYDVPFAWVRKVAIRLAVKNRFRRYRELSVEELPETSYYQAPDSYIDLHRAITQLPRVQKAVVMLYYLDDLSIEEVAEIVGCRKGTVKTHLARARVHLAELLGDKEVA